MAAPEELDRVVLWFSHVLVQHLDADLHRVPLTPDLWFAPQPGVTLERQAARTRAEELLRRIREGSESFDSIASKESDDLLRRDTGGRVFGVRATDLALWPELLDALAAVPAGQVSEIVETEFGFHILQPAAPPSERLLDGQRIIIGHRDAQLLQFVARPGRQVSTRTREDALVLASQISSRAKAAPDTFDALVEQYTEHADVVRKGRLGTQSSVRGVVSGRELAELAELEQDELSAPFETALGVELLRRLPASVAPAWIASAKLELAYDASAGPGTPGSKEATRQLANSISTLLARAPDQFPILQQRYCCNGVEHWPLGAGPLPLAERVEGLEVGAIASDPWDTGFSLMFVMRVDPHAFPPPDARFELPNPDAPDLDALVRRGSPKGIAAFTRTLGVDASSELSLPDDASREIQTLHLRLADEFEHEDDPTARVQKLRVGLDDIRLKLGPDLYKKYFHWLSDRVASGLLGNTR